MKRQKSLKQNILTIKLSYIQANLLIFILIFANIGGLLLASSKAATVKRVNFIYFCSTDIPCNQDGIDTLNSVSYAVQGYYLSQLGVTFTRGSISAVQGKNRGAYYGTGSNSNKTSNTWYNIASELKQKRLYNSSDSKIVVLTNFNSTSNCGVGDVGGTLAVINLFANNWCNPNKDAVFAHEFGHLLGAGHLDDGKLMHTIACQSYSGQGLYNCPINANQASFFKLHPWLNTNKK